MRRLLAPHFLALPVIGQLEYRWQAGGGAYDTYNMIHTAWLRYDAGKGGTFKVGIVRVPFGPAAYGGSTGFFFDQH